MPSDFYRQHVHIDPVALDAFGATLAAGELSAPDWRLPVYPDDNNRFVTFATIANAINYAFGDLATGDKYIVELDGIPWSGATAMMAALARAQREGLDIMNPYSLEGITVRDAAHIFRPAAGSPPIPLLAQRAAMLNSVGATLASGVDIPTLVDKVAGDAGALVEEIVGHFAAYADDRWLHPVTKEPLVYDKRARLMAVMYEGRARASGGHLPRLVNLEAVGPIVDYQLPRVLRAAGVISYSPALAAAVDSGQLIPAGSVEELALREATAVTVDALLGAVNSGLAEPITMVELDFALWSAGRKAAGRHHLTATTAY